MTERVRNTGIAPAFEKEYIRKRRHACAGADWNRRPDLIPSRTADAVCFVVDLSKRKQAQRERDHLLIERVAMLESVGEGIYGLDNAGRCTFINRAAAAMLGYEPEECLGRNMHELIHFAARRRIALSGTRVSDLRRIPKWPMRARRR